MGSFRTSSDVVQNELCHGKMSSRSSKRAWQGRWRSVASFTTRRQLLDFDPTVSFVIGSFSSSNNLRISLRFLPPEFLFLTMSVDAASQADDSSSMLGFTRFYRRYGARAVSAGDSVSARDYRNVGT